MSTTGYAYAILSFSLLKIDGGAIKNAFPGSTWERVYNFNSSLLYRRD
ncbi:MAG: hypothetical protein V7K54_23855 [Nostoc sp.]